jgi:selenocysteine-specific elongation factor
MALNIIAGTAGHIDHGKTALVKALTGIDADRLEEEKRRGITIDLGFAHLELAGPDGNPVRFGFVDVPGHERFVRNMLAGIGSIDLVLLIIAADEGIKPQTREHFEICKLLGIEHGIAVLTKADRVTPERVVAARNEAEELVRGSFLESAPIIAVSAVTGAGLDELRQAMLRAAAQTPSRASDSHLRLPIDRVFTMKGFGTVVTGTLVSGSVTVGDEVAALPGENRFRVRGIQVHNAAMESAHAGERTALNLAGAQKTDLARGMTLAPPDIFATTSLLDAHLEMIDSARLPKAGRHFHLHSFTAESTARLQYLSATTGHARLRLATPMLLLPGDRFILRQFSPVVTVGGGVVLDATPLKSSSESLLRVMLEGSASEQLLARIERKGRNGLSASNAIAETGWTRGRVEAFATELAATKKIVPLPGAFIATEHFTHLLQLLLESLGRFHERNPLASGVGRKELRDSLHLTPEVFATAITQLVADKKIEETADLLRLAGRAVMLKDDESQARHTIEQAFASAGLRVPAMKDILAALPLDTARSHKIVTILLREGLLVKLGDDLVFHASALQSLRQTMRDYKSKSATIDVARFKEIASVSRKYAIPLLEFLDRERITRRQGDVRIIL